MRVRVFSGLAVVALSVGTLLAGVTLAWSHSNDSLTDQVHACIANVSKVVRIVGVIGEVQDQAAAEGTAIHWPATVPTPPASGGGLRVVDSSVPPNTVGVLISQGLVTINADGALFAVPLTRDGFLGDPQCRLFYELLDCQGPAFFGGAVQLPPWRTGGNRRLVDLSRSDADSSANPSQPRATRRSASRRRFHSRVHELW